MIPPLFFLGTIALFVTWCVGMARLWRGRPALALWSATLSVLLSAATFGAVIAFDRHSDFLFGGLGSGDGMGMIGLVLFAACAAAGGLIALSIAGATYFVRRGRAHSSPREV